jgi:hypothetical protein
MGMSASLVTLTAGMRMTMTAPADVAQYFPSLTVSAIKLSTICGTIVDSFFEGNGFVTLQGPETPIPLHPFAIAGFASLAIHAIKLIPFGATDGGRMSLALVGRQGSSILGVVVWVTLLLSVLLGGSIVLQRAWIMLCCSNDLEAPCRDEVDPVNSFRSQMIFGQWFVAVLSIAPM